MREDAFKLCGAVLDGKYRVDEVIGEGGFGVVYKGFHTTFEHSIAIKCLKIPAHFVPNAQKVFFEKFKEEGKLLSQLSSAHFSIVRVFDFGVTQSEVVRSIPYLVLEWLEGASLEDFLKERRAALQKPHTEREAIELLLPAVDAIAAAHAMNVAHRDIKPPNIFVLSRPARLSGDFGAGDLEDSSLRKRADVKVLDFGIAKAMQEGETATQIVTRTSSGFSAFSPQYGAPEQFFAKRFGTTGPWTDVYALGLCLVELVSGRTALDGEEPQELFEASTNDLRPTPRARGAVVSDAFEAVMAKALAKMPKDRFSNASAFHAALVNVLMGRPLNLDKVPSRPSSPSPIPENAVIDTAAFLEASSVAASTPPKEFPGRTVKAAPLSANVASSRTELGAPIQVAGVIAPLAPAPAKEKKRFPVIYIAPGLLILGGFGLWYGFGKNEKGTEKEAETSASVAPALRPPAAPSKLIAKPPDTSAEGFRLFLNRVDPANVGRATVLFQKACDAGYPDGCAGLGYTMFDGALGKLDSARGFHLFETSCAAGSLWGCNGLGDSYRDGFGVKKDYAKASEFLNKACDGGEANGCTALASVYTFGWGTPKDLKRAFELDVKACDAGNMSGCANKGRLLRTGMGVDKDEKKGFELVDRACAAGNMLGCYYEADALSDGSGTVKDAVRAGNIFQKVCNNGEHQLGASACADLAEAYASGSGVPQDAAKAAELYQKANALNEESCGVGDGGACLDIARAYEGGKGVAVDLKQMTVYEQKSCDAEDMEGCTAVGIDYANGTGVTKDVPRALSLYQKACDAGEGRGCNSLGTSVLGQDVPSAIALFRRSCDAGYQEGCDNLKNLTTQPEQ